MTNDQDSRFRCRLSQQNRERQAQALRAPATAASQHRERFAPRRRRKSTACGAAYTLVASVAEQVREPSRDPAEHESGATTRFRSQNRQSPPMQARHPTRRLPPRANTHRRETNHGSARTTTTPRVPVPGHPPGHPRPRRQAHGPNGGGHPRPVRPPHALRRVEDVPRPYHAENLLEDRNQGNALDALREHEHSGPSRAGRPYLDRLAVGEVPRRNW